MNAEAATTKPLCHLIDFYNKGTWEKGSWDGLKEGQIFRLRELDGTLVDEGNDSEICIAMSDATPEPEPMYHSVEAESFVHVGKDHLLSSRLKVVKDGEQVGFVDSIDMRNGTMVKQGIIGPFDYVEIAPKIDTPAHKAEDSKKATIPGHEPPPE